ncbi:hypothetical protein EVAR_94375_1 [Eumeta japonica]|uniref:Uncharacterized protein n=1 Tax=Eumeta variegata TaxID=151549 RepID=A0A4C1TPY1_EUMVA|nr:hypothetical protein EVAR_94375_1 [Eumeta japonica]
MTSTLLEQKARTLGMQGRSESRVSTNASRVNALRNGGGGKVTHTTARAHAHAHAPPGRDIRNSAALRRELYANELSMFLNAQ